MQLQQIIASALEQLDRGTDAQTTKHWKKRLIRFANEAVTDLAQAMALKRQDTAMVVDGLLDTTTLPEQCARVVSVWRDGKAVPFLLGPDSGAIRVSCPDGEVKVIYRWLPRDMSSDIDTPALPEYAHALIVTYVVGRERATSDPSMQRGANIYFELYNAGKAQLRRTLGELDTFKIYNKW